MNRLEELKNYIAGLETDFTKFYDKGNHAAGTRVRKAMQGLKKLANDIRAEVQAKKSEGGDQP
ncbi:MAG TPA: hypothetical protein VE978_23985 [Chitinophagales bacterium]|nr:hypothetical protein [Chitinophagales bacterium]